MMKYLSLLSDLLLII